MQLVQWPDPQGATDWKILVSQLISALQVAFSADYGEVGALREFRGTTVPDGYLITDGSTFSAASYPDLAAKLGGTTLPTITSAYGVGNVVGIKT